MKKQYKILFSDVGGVILSNAWGHESRMVAAKKFKIDYGEMNVLHNFIFNVWEMGKISMDDYLHTVVFHKKRDFSREEFEEFMFAQSVLLPDTLQ